MISVLLTLFVVLAFQTQVLAQSSSTNYQVNEATFGTGGEIDASSTNYGAQSSVGGLGVGDASSTNYDANTGFLTQNEPYLEMTISGPNVDFGTLDPTAYSSADSQGGTCNCTFSVRTYLSSQYVVSTVSNPPTSENNDVFTAKATQAVPSSDQNVEEFGINLVANTSPTIGANLSNVPDNSFADGKIATGYATANQFKYVVDDIIASSAATANTSATGQTDYTISYIMKPSRNTAAGLYTMIHDIVVTPTF